MRLENMSIGHRIAITVIIALVILLALAFIGFLTGNWNEDQGARPGYGLASAESHAAEIEPCMDAETRERIRGIFFEAIDEGLKEHIKHVWSVWMRDDRGQPERAAVGVRQGVKAYIGSRESAMKWDPKPC